MPGAARSGFTARSNLVGPRELYDATVSSDRLVVPHVFSAPTVIANGELPGEVMPPRIGTPVARLAVVAGGRDDDDACGDGARDRLAERIGGGRLASPGGRATG